MLREHERVLSVGGGDSRLTWSVPCFRTFSTPALQSSLLLQFAHYFSCIVMLIMSFQVKMVFSCGKDGSFREY